MFILDCAYPSLVPVLDVVRFILTIIQYVVPVVLILMGTIDLVKAVTQGKDEEIKKGQKTLITRAIAAVIVFLIPLLVSVIMGLIGSTEWKECWRDAKPRVVLDPDKVDENANN